MAAAVVVVVVSGGRGSFTLGGRVVLADSWLVGGWWSEKGENGADMVLPCAPARSGDY